MNEHFIEVLDHYAKRAGVFDTWKNGKGFLLPNSMKHIIDTTSTMSPNDLKERFQKIPFYLAIDMEDGMMYSFSSSHTFWVIAKWITIVLVTDAEDYLECNGEDAIKQTDNFYRDFSARDTTRMYVRSEIDRLSETCKFYINPKDSMIFLVKK